MVSYGSFDVVLTGDATRITEDKIRDRYNDSWLEAEVLKVGHHGSNYTSTGIDWVNAVKPNVAIVSAGYSNTHGHPRKEVIERLFPKTGEGINQEFFGTNMEQSALVGLSSAASAA